MIQIAICDDSEISLHNLNQAVTDILKTNHELAEITLYRESKFLNYDITEGHFFDLILTDIQMPHINGMELASNIRKHLPNALIIFITAHSKYALDAFELSIFRYIDKENIPKKLPFAIMDALKMIHLQENQYYLLSYNRMQRKILLKDIVYIQREGKNSVFYLANQETLKERKSLLPIMEKLNNSDFLFVDRGTIVNLIHIISIHDTTIVLDNEHSILASTPRMKELKFQLQKLWRDLL